MRRRIGPRRISRCARRSRRSSARGRLPEEVDLIILGTDSPDYITPATSVVLQAKLGAKNAGHVRRRLRLRFVSDRDVESPPGLMATNPGLKTVLVVGGLQMHKLAAENDPMIFFYGDGAGAAVLERSEEPGFIAAAFQADGTYANEVADPGRRHRRAGDGSGRARTAARR